MIAAAHEGAALDVRESQTAREVADGRELVETQEKFLAHLQKPEVQARVKQAFDRGLQTDGPLERNFGSLLGLQ